MIFFMLPILNFIIFISSIVCSIVLRDKEIFVLFISLTALSFMFLYPLVRLGYKINMDRLLDKFPMKQYQLELKRASLNDEKLIFKYENHSYKLLNSQNIEFNVRRIIFKKAFISSFITRSVRYSTISNKLPLYNLYRKTLHIKKYPNLIVRFEKHNRVKEYQIVKDNISKFTFLSQMITCLGIMFKYGINKIGHSIFETIRINEYIYEGNI